jgi:catechol 2,3-dioxygenase
VTSPQPPAATRPPLHEIAHLGHVELLTPRLQESLWFFTDVLGLTETGREGNSVYLRTWDDYEQHTVKLTAHDTSGIRRVGLRAASQAALEARVAAIEATGLGIGWKDGDPGIGPTYLFRDPDGHELELYWETTWYAPPDELKPALKNQAQAYPARGVGVRRLDHVNYLAQDVPPNGDFVRDVLGGRVTEQIMLDDGTISGQWLHFTNKGYDLVYTRDWTGTTGRLHHIAFAPDTREDIVRAADICLDHGVFIETGPHKHAIQQTFFLYVYEPGGNRIELCNPAARLVLAPDWRTITWTEAERAKGQAWGLKTIESFHTHGTPPVGLSQARAALVDAVLIKWNLDILPCLKTEDSNCSCPVKERQAGEVRGSQARYPGRFPAQSRRAPPRYSWLPSRQRCRRNRRPCTRTALGSRAISHPPARTPSTAGS